jgi:hypothetical protein
MTVGANMGKQSGTAARPRHQKVLQIASRANTRSVLLGSSCMPASCCCELGKNVHVLLHWLIQLVIPTACQCCLCTTSTAA